MKPTFTSLIDGLLKEAIGVGRLDDETGLLDVVDSTGLDFGVVLLA